MNVRGATSRDADAITAIYNEGITSGQSTFETELRTAADMARRLSDALPRHSWLVAEDDDGDVAGWAATMPYSTRPCYDGIAEFSIYLSSSHRGRGIGRLLLTALLDEATRAGLYKVTSRVFVDNAASRALCGSLGFREVGVHLRHGQVAGVWHDVVTVEVLLRGLPRPSGYANSA